MILKWQEGIIKKIEQVTPNTRRIWIDLPSSDFFVFIPGQFITLDLPISDQRNKRWRSYSIASMPDGSNCIELIIVHLEGGLATDYIFNKLIVGSKVKIAGPQGVFKLPADLKKDLYLIATGTGIAPFRSMIHYIKQNQIPFNKICLIFGTRTKNDLLYFNEMKDLEKSLPGFSYIPTLSREDWEGRKGYVHAIYEELCQNKQPATFMLCGWRQMVDEAMARITNLGYNNTDIICELYG